MKKILVVEDDRTMRYILVLRLQNENYDVEEVENGEKAIQKVCEKKYDLVLMDLHMPVLNGYKTAQKLRANGYKGFLIGITGSQLEDDIIKAEESGFNSCLSKISMDNLEEKIREMFKS